MSHYVVTLPNSEDCRIVIMSFVAHENGVFIPTNLNGEQSYGRYKFTPKTVEKLFIVNVFEVIEGTACHPF